MAIIRQTKETKAKKSGKAAWTCVLKRVPVKANTRDGYVLIGVDEKTEKVLEGAPIDVVVKDNVILVNTSRYCEYAISGEQVDDDAAGGKGWANVKLKHASYDYSYKGRKGHTDKLEVVAINYVTYEAWGGLGELLDDDDGSDLGDLPF